MFREQLKWATTTLIGTAKRLAGWDASGVAIEVAPASQSETVAGTEDLKFLTPFNLESKRSIKSVTQVNNATGANVIDCGGKEEVNILFTVTVTGGITLSRVSDTALQTMSLVIPITGANIPITFPSDVRMSRYNEVTANDGWYQSSKILQVSSIGAGDLHEFNLMKAGSIYILRYDGPVRP